MAANSTAHAAGARYQAALRMDGSAPTAAAAAANSRMKLAPGAAMAQATARNPMMSAAAHQKPQKPARLASHAAAPPATHRATAPAAMCMGRGCAIQEAPVGGGTLPTATANANHAAHSAVPATRVPSAPAAPHKD